MKTIGAAEAKRIISKSKIRILNNGDDGRLVQIKYGGRWLDFGSTDLLDDVRTTTAWATDAYFKSPKKHHQCLFGARITKRGFFTIDSGTDG